MTTTADWVTEKVSIPDLLRLAPHVRPVLDRYGLRGCGGCAGPAESLGFFARAHDVPVERLLGELRERLDHPPPSANEPPSRPGPADGIYRPFFRSGIAVVLTLGAAWGAYLLLRIALTGEFTSAGLHDVNAHGHAQIFGWVGLFVMGFAYQAFPRWKQTALALPQLARASLVLMLLGLVGRSICEPLAATLPWVGPLAIGSAWLEVVVIALFVGIILMTWHRAGKGLAIPDYYVIASMAWFVAQAVAEAVYLAATLAAAGREELVALVATWQGALRDAQIHGFALLMILGVSMRLLHGFYGLAAPGRRWSLAALISLNLVVLGEVTGLILMRVAGHGWAALWYGSVVLLSGTVAALLLRWRVLGRVGEQDRSLKFIRAAYTWLLISLAMLLLLPVYQFVLLPALAPSGSATALGFSHAYYGAIRHAITVGFISLMIVGVAARVVPVLNGVEGRRLTALWLPFVLLNTGCALRVVMQTLTDFTPHAFPVAGVSGLLEVTGLALWGTHLWLVMAGRARYTRPAGATYVPGTTIEGEHLVGEVLDRHPELLETFLELGFQPLANPLLRATLARGTTIRQACRLLGRDPAVVLQALNAALPALPKRLRSLELVSNSPRSD